MSCKRLGDDRAVHRRAEDGASPTTNPGSRVREAAVDESAHRVPDEPDRLVDVDPHPIEMMQDVRRELRERAASGRIVDGRHAVSRAVEVVRERAHRERGARERVQEDDVHRENVLAKGDQVSTSRRVAADASQAWASSATIGSATPSATYWRVSVIRSSPDWSEPDSRTASSRLRPMLGALGASPPGRSQRETRPAQAWIPRTTSASGTLMQVTMTAAVPSARNGRSWHETRSSSAIRSANAVRP